MIGNDAQVCSATKNRNSSTNKRKIKNPMRVEIENKNSVIGDDTKNEKKNNNHTQCYLGV